MILKEFINWLFPSKCLICNCQTNENSIFCSKCFPKITIIDYPFCKICGKILDSSFEEDCVCNTCLKFPRQFELARSLFQYDKISKQIIMKIKKQSDNGVAKNCCRMLFLKYKNILETADLIIPVPSHWTRIFKRGYNPPDIIAIALSKISKIPFSNVLKRIKKTQYQKNKYIHERFENVEDAFYCEANLSEKTVILVDDVFTTGATLNECSKILKNQGCKKIFCLTIGTTRAI